MKREELVKQFCKNLEGLLYANEKGTIALRRSYGCYLKSENTNMSAIATFYKALPIEVNKKDEDTYFLCAVIAAYQGTCYGKKTIGQLVKHVIATSSTFESKFNYLLTLDVIDELFYDKLYSIIKRLNLRDSESKEVKINIEKLLEDLLYWEYRSIESESKPQKWAREVYQRKEENNE